MEIKKTGLNAFQLKWIAIIGMIISHLPYAFWEIMPVWLKLPTGFVGGFTFAIMAYFVSEGYKHTSNLKKYMLRLFIFGLIATPFHVLVIALPWLNIMFTILLSVIVLILYDKIKYRAIFWILYIIVIVPIAYMFFEFYFIGTTMVLLYHIIKNEKRRRIIPPIFAGVCWLLLAWLGITTAKMVEAAGGIEVLQAAGVELMGMGTLSTEIFRNAFFMVDVTFMQLLIPFALGTFFVAFLLSQYNGDRGKKMKWTFYVIYPAHFAVLAIIGWALGLINPGVLLFW
jgi:hypothetical protein